MSLSDVKVGRVGIGASDVDEVVEIANDATVDQVADELDAKVDMLKAAEIANDVAFDSAADEVEKAIEHFRERGKGKRAVWNEEKGDFTNPWQELTVEQARSMSDYAEAAVRWSPCPLDKHVQASWRFKQDETGQAAWRSSTFRKRVKPHGVDQDELKRLMALKQDEFDREMKRLRIEKGEYVIFGKAYELRQHRRAQKAAQDAQHQAGGNE